MQRMVITTILVVAVVVQLLEWGMKLLIVELLDMNVVLLQEVVMGEQEYVHRRHRQHRCQLQQHYY